MEMLLHRSPTLILCKGTNEQILEHSGNNMKSGPRTELCSTPNVQVKKLHVHAYIIEDLLATSASNLHGYISSSCYEHCTDCGIPI